MGVYSPGQVADKTGFSLDTLRYYERIGLLHKIDRTAGGRRRFTETDLGWLLMLRCLRETGMPIKQMIHFVELARDTDVTVPERLAMLEAHDRGIEEQIRRLRGHQEQIRRKITIYRSKRRPPTPATTEPLLRQAAGTPG
jgi:DNA-binding transcriptional MerR regulator